MTTAPTVWALLGLLLLWTTPAAGQPILSANQISALVENENDWVNIVVKFKDADDEVFAAAAGVNTRRQDRSRVPQSVQNMIQSSSNADGMLVTAHFERTNAMGLKVHKSQLESLLNDPAVAYVEHDRLMYPMAVASSANDPWGLEVIQAHSPNIPDGTPAQTQTSSNPCFKVCVVDGGLLVDHPDIVSYNRVPVETSKALIIIANWTTVSSNELTHSFLVFSISIYYLSITHSSLILEEPGTSRGKTLTSPMVRNGIILSTSMVHMSR
jgi:hypothetical protein